MNWLRCQRSPLTEAMHAKHIWNWFNSNAYLDPWRQEISLDTFVAGFPESGREAAADAVPPAPQTLPLQRIGRGT